MEPAGPQDVNLQHGEIQGQEARGHAQDGYAPQAQSRPLVEQVAAQVEQAGGQQHDAKLRRSPKLAPPAADEDNAGQHQQQGTAVQGDLDVALAQQPLVEGHPRGFGGRGSGRHYLGRYGHLLNGRGRSRRRRLRDEPCPQVGQLLDVGLAKFLDQVGRQPLNPTICFRKQKLQLAERQQILPSVSRAALGADRHAALLPGATCRTFCHPRRRCNLLGLGCSPLSPFSRWTFCQMRQVQRSKPR